jgi:L-aminopeptidase/D-esterase-like protein
VEGILVGHFTNLTAPFRTGTSVLLLPDKATAGVDVRGGGPGTAETDVLDGRGPVDKVDAVFLSGGSAYGLAARTGVVQCVDEMGKGFQLAGRPPRKMPMVVGAIIFDLGRGGGFGSRPTADFGYQACKAAAKGPIAQGTVGAGAGANSGGGVKGGFGTASVDLGNGVIIGAVAVVNSVGQTFRSDNCQFYTAYLELGNEYGDLNPTQACPATTTAAESTEPAPESSETQSSDSPPGPVDIPVPVETDNPLKEQQENPSPEPSQPPEDPEEPGLPPIQPLNTTIGVVAANIKLSKAQINKMATAAHDGMARSIRPSHTLLDGDTIFRLSTDKVDLACIARQTGADPDLVLSDIYSAAADTFSRAVNHAILRATTAGTTRSYCDIRPGVCTGIPLQNNTASTGGCSISGAGGGVLAATGATSLVVIIGAVLLILGTKLGWGARRQKIPSEESRSG